MSLLFGLWELFFKIRILVFRLKSSRESGFSSKPPNSGRLATLLGFLGDPGVCSFRKKLEIWGFQIAGNALKLSILPSPTLFLYRLKYFTIPSGGPFWLLGGGVRTPRTPPPRAYGPGQPLTRSNGARFLSYKHSIKLTRLWGWPFYPGQLFSL